MSNTPEAFHASREEFQAADQGHLFQFWDELDENGRALLLRQLSAIDLELVGRLANLIQDQGAPTAASSFEAPETFPLVRDAAQKQQAKNAQAAGRELLTEGKVGYLLVAGGQGSRLGFEGPKGKYEVGPVTGRSLFGWHAARIRASRQAHGGTAPWYIMTSPANDAETRAYFEEQDHFGLGRDNIRFFQQGMLPALTEDGRIVLSSKGTIFLAPNGHGGTLEALATSGCLADAEARGVEQLSYFQVDNPLARPTDPLFLGLHGMSNAEMSSKVVNKTAPDEKVGVLGMADGCLGCIEYSDLPAGLRNALDDAGNLLFRAGNIANHVIRRDFVERLTRGSLSLPWHLARKSLATIDAGGKPTSVAGVKFETFIFDALSESATSVTLEVDRRLEFSPIKNALGASSPTSCRADLGAIFSSWAEAAGGPTPPRNADRHNLIEVDPCYAEDREAFLARAAGATGAPEEVNGGHLYS